MPCPAGTPAPPEEHSGTWQFLSPGGRFTARAVNLRSLLEWAYEIQAFQHSDGPAWMRTDRYDIAAKAEGNPTATQMKLMVRTLLTERFHLILHQEKKELPVYVIVLGKAAPKLLPAKDGETQSIQAKAVRDADQKIASYHLVATRFSIAQLAETFARQMGRVFVDETGLKGEFDFTMDLRLSDSESGAMDPSVLMRAIREELGLTLKAQKSLVDYLVIDGAERIVTAN